MPRWKINLYILWTSQVISLLSFSLGLPFLSLYIQDFGITDPNQVKFYTGILSAAPAITMAIVSPIWGRLADRYGRKLMILRAMFAASLIIAGMGIVNAVWQLVVLRLFQGLFTGTITAANAFIASSTPTNKMSSSLGFMSSANFIGFAIGPIIGGFFAETTGYRFSFIVGGILMFIGCILVYLLLVEDKSTYGFTRTKADNDNAAKRIFSSFIISLLFILLFHRILRSVFSPFIALFVQENLGTSKGVAATTGFINGGVAFITAMSGIIFGRLGEKYNKRTMLILSMSAAIVLSMLVSFTGNLTAFTCFYIILFLFIGGVEPIITSITAEKTAPENRGMLFGYQGTIGSIGMLASPVFGTFISVNFSIKAILLLMPVICTIILVLVVKLKYSENTLMENKQDIGELT